MLNLLSQPSAPIVYQIVHFKRVNRMIHGKGRREGEKRDREGGKERDREGRKAGGRKEGRKNFEEEEKEMKDLV